MPDLRDAEWLAPGVGGDRTRAPLHESFRPCRGSVLENRIFGERLNVESISTANCSLWLLTSDPLLTIDATIFE